ncbi:hypothetical protein M0813_07367 [Anaeramoeba flamelloides]|uniref:Uncharacterized protein n=1 Tax=Anaeramoeba flamelloides TaxID=1746091 RepID=A0ABQ8XB66_9EUKA|nr:hypothetical protein M0813_07367 [Anaeramoeba flamelloides]
MNLHILTQKLNLDIEKNTPNKTRTLRKRNFQNFENFNLRGFSHESESESEESDSDYDPETLTKKKQFKRTVSKKPQSLEKNLKKKKKRLKIKNKNKSTLTLVRKRKTPNKKKKKLNLTQWSEIGNHVNFSENDHQVSYGHPQEITENQISVLESFKLLMNSELTNKIGDVRSGLECPENRPIWVLKHGQLPITVIMFIPGTYLKVFQKNQRTPY